MLFNYLIYKNSFKILIYKNSFKILIYKNSFKIVYNCGKHIGIRCST